MNLSTMSYRVADGVAHLRLDRPEGANALNVDFSKDIREVMIAVEHDPTVKSVAVTAEGKVFCAGGDLKEFASLGDGLKMRLQTIISDLLPHDYITHRATPQHDTSFVKMPLSVL